MKKKLYEILTRKDMMDCMDMCDSGEEVDVEYLRTSFISLVDSIYDLVADEYEEDFQRVYKDHVGKKNTVSKQVEKNTLVALAKEYMKTKCTWIDYVAFWNTRIKEQRHSLTDLTFEKLNPINIGKYYCFDVNESVVGIDMMSALEDGYLDDDVTLSVMEALMSQGRTDLRNFKKEWGL